MTFTRTLFACFLALFSLTAAQAAEPNPLDADPFAGKFLSDRLTLELSAAGDSYTGTIILDKRTFRATAKRDGENLSGSFESDGHQFPFTAALDGAKLSFRSGTKSFSLVKESENPLDTDGNAPGDAPSPAPQGNPGQAQQAGHQTPPAEYVVVNSTQFGQALAIQKPGVNSIQSALQSTFPELGQYFGSRATVLTAYEDTKDRSAGGASFAANFKGVPIKGWVTCKLYPQGAVVIVIFCRTDAPQGEWAKLMGTPAKPQGEGAPHGEGAPAQQIPLREYRFPDGTGSVGIAPGWKTDAQTGMTAVIITGPAGQQVMLGYYLTVVTPNSQAVQTQLQLEANARQFGYAPPPPMQMLVAPFAGPTQTLANLLPQINQLSQRNSGIGVDIDNLVELKQAAPLLQGASASICTWGMTLTTREGKSHLKVLGRLEVTPISNDSFMYSTTTVRAPDATFDQDLPVMLAMVSSIRENADVIQQKTNENIDAMNQRFNAQQKAHQELLATYAASNRNWEKNQRDRDQQNRNWEANQNCQSRSVDNFDEVIRGYRTVEDTTTGEKTQVDLGNVDQIVDKLNEFQPDRYRQIPLRDESNPIPQPR